MARSDTFAHFSKVALFLFGLIFSACSVNSVYLGGRGAFSNYDDYSKWNNSNEGEISGSTSDLGTLADDIVKKATSRSVLGGMRNSLAIQNATMRPYKIAGRWYYPARVDIGDTQEGIASWYGPNFHAKKTSNGETYNMHAHTAASKTLPMNTIVRVINLENRLETIVRINDRGPFVDGRIIDLSNIAAKDIKMVQKGTAKVRVEIIGFGGQIAKEYASGISANSIEQELKNKEEPKTTTIKTIEGGEFGLQIGSFSVSDNAKSALESFKKQLANMPSDYSLVIESSDLHRIFVRGFKSEAEALDFSKEFKLNSNIIIRIDKSAK
ncbi:MAG: septal ring lytic transglycosylase RlpA family protein [Helicobacter sp.]|nr:septal ring lytic transglycosylase RlpA family protein [Helicobacter sp.]